MSQETNNQNQDSDKKNDPATVKPDTTKIMSPDGDKKPVDGNKDAPAQTRPEVRK